MGLPMAQRHEQELRSANFVVIERRRSVLKHVLGDHGLNPVQHRLLLFVDDADKRGLNPRMQELGTSAGLKDSVVTTAVNALVDQGLVERLTDQTDARSRHVRLTQRGRSAIDAIHRALIDGMHEAFNPQHDRGMESLLVKGVVEGAHVSNVWPTSIVEAHPTSANLLAIDLVAQNLEGALKRETGVGYNEARLVQRLDETGRCMRVSDLAEQLELPMTTVTRAAQRLEKRAWVCRYASACNRVAVFFGMTDEGRQGAGGIGEVLATAASKMYWDNLKPAYMETVRAIAEMYQDRMDEMDRAAVARDSLLLDRLLLLPSA